jgi:hypothetical protein
MYVYCYVYFYVCCYVYFYVYCYVYVMCMLCLDHAERRGGGLADR